MSYLWPLSRMKIAEYFSISNTETLCFVSNRFKTFHLNDKFRMFFSHVWGYSSKPLFFQYFASMLLIYFSLSRTENSLIMDRVNLTDHMTTALLFSWWKLLIPEFFLFWVFFLFFLFWFFFCFSCFEIFEMICFCLWFWNKLINKNLLRNFRRWIEEARWSVLEMCCK